MFLGMLPTGTPDFLLGLIAAGVLGTLLFVVYATYRITSGTRKVISLVKMDGVGEVTVPLTSPLKKRSFIRTVLRRNWKEDIDVQLQDYQGRVTTFHLGYHFWYGFSLRVKGQTDSVRLNAVELKPKRNYYLKNNMILS